MAVKQFFVRDPKGRLRTVNASTTRGAISVFAANYPKAPGGDYEVREKDKPLDDWDVFYVKEGR